MLLLVRNVVKDFDRWKAVLDANLDPARADGLTVGQMWRSVDNPNEIFFTLEVEERGRARAFMQAPESAATGVESGVLEGEAFFLEPVG